jgi:hypothetical protein
MWHRKLFAAGVRRFWLPAVAFTGIAVGIILMVSRLGGESVAARGTGTAVQISYDAATFKRLQFFDAHGVPLISYYRRPDGTYDLFELSSGTSHPRYGRPLTPVSADVVAEIERQFVPRADATRLQPRPTLPAGTAHAATAKTLAAVTAPTFAPRPRPRVREFVVSSGTVLRVALDAPIGTATAQAGQLAEGALAEPIIADEFVVAPAGAHVWLRVAGVVDAPRKGKPSLALELDGVTVAGERVCFGTHELRIEGQGQSLFKRSLKAVGGTVVGALVGAATGGKGGAVKGATLGVGVGTTAAVLSKGKSMELPAQTVLEFQTSENVVLTIPGESLQRYAQSDGTPSRERPAAPEAGTSP